jgi:urea transporter
LLAARALHRRRVQVVAERGLPMMRAWRRLVPVWPDDLVHARASLSLLLRMYAGCLFSGSAWAGAFVLGATLLSPSNGLLGLLAVASALATAYGLGVVSERNLPTVYTYNALFIGMGANSLFAHPAIAVLFAVLGAAASALLTASLREASLRFGLPSLSLPFVIVYWCAIGCGRQLGLAWTVPVFVAPTQSGWLPQLARSFLEALGAIAFNTGALAGVLFLLALAATSVHALLFAVLGYAVALATSVALGLDPGTQFTAEINAMFACLALGIGWYVPAFKTYARALAGAFLCTLLTASMMRPFGVLLLTPLSLPFNLTVWLVLLVARQHRDAEPEASSPRRLPDSTIAWGIAYPNQNQMR